MGRTEVGRKSHCASFGKAQGLWVDGGYLAARLPRCLVAGELDWDAADIRQYFAGQIRGNRRINTRGHGVTDPAKTLRYPARDFRVGAYRGKKMDHLIGYEARHFGPFSLFGQHV